MNKLKYLIQLNLTQNIGDVKLKSLLDYFGSADRILCSSKSELMKVGGISSGIAEAILNISKNKVEKELKLIEQNNIDIISIKDRRYPENLTNIYSPPILLYVKGQLQPQDKNAIAIVGSRRATYYGLSTAENLAYKLAKYGITIVSGMARGIDSAAHKGALKAGGRTIAVFGSGLFNIYPPESKKLFDEVSANGAVVSEFPLNTPPFKQNFPKRNRIISGLSLGVIVAEAAKKSGALITSDFALEQGREVFAVPGKINSATSKGTHMLIKQGAKLVETAEDILEELNIEIEDNYDGKTLHTNELNEKEKTVYSFLNKEPQHIDGIAEKSDIPLNLLLSILMKLQMKGFVKEIHGKKFVRS